MPAAPVFITAAYGEDYVPFVAPYLQAVHRHHPESHCIVHHQDLPARELALLRRAYPACEFIEIRASIEGALSKRIAQKLLAWQQDCSRFADRPIVFLDCDIMLVRPLTPFLDAGADITFTWQDHKYPVNTGVILASNGRTAGEFLARWIEATDRITAFDRLLKESIAASGAPDQHSFRQLVGWVNYDREFTRPIGERTMRFRGIPCPQLNAVRCAPITDTTYAIHFKSGWHAIILDHGAYHKTRPQAQCEEMHRFWRANRDEAYHRLLSPYLESLRGPADAPDSGASLLLEDFEIGEMIRLRGGDTVEGTPFVHPSQGGQPGSHDLMWGTSSGPRRLRRALEQQVGQGVAVLISAELGPRIEEIVSELSPHFGTVKAIIVETGADSGPVRTWFAERFARVGEWESGWPGRTGTNSGRLTSGNDRGEAGGERGRGSNLLVLPFRRELRNLAKEGAGRPGDRRSGIQASFDKLFDKLVRG